MTMQAVSYSKEILWFEKTKIFTEKYLPIPRVWNNTQTELSVLPSWVFILINYTYIKYILFCVPKIVFEQDNEGFFF